uniref:Uncharacterized protein n=1 Tax=Rhizophora mucronata TaxID=61149 RepID=A0A2P2PMK9_RHIMU
MSSKRTLEFSRSLVLNFIFSLCGMYSSNFPAFHEFGFDCVFKLKLA